jgi:signal transduction histidine kinase
VMKLEILDAAKSKDYFNVIQQSVLRLNKILEELMGLTKIKETPIEEKEIDFKRLLHQIRLNLVDMPNYEAVQWEVLIKTTLPIKADENLLRIIIQNLAENALMFARTQRNEPYLQITIENLATEQLLIKVKDNGQGIKAEALDKVFNMFYRASEASKGSGLGLYILKNALEKLKGSIEIETQFGRGTTFTVLLPVK